MKTGAAILLFLLTACVSADVANSWNGADVDSLIMAWGAPDREYQMPNGGQEISYTHERFIVGVSYYCTVKFTTNARGVVINSTVEGNLGGCNRLLGSKPAYQ